MNWPKALGVYLLIGLGSFLVLFPAWLPNKPTLPVEDGVVEGLQFVLLLASGAFLFAAAYQRKHIRSIYRALGAFCVMAAVSENDHLLAPILGDLPFKWILIPTIIWVLIDVFTHKKALRRFTEIAIRTPASGFIGSALILIYIFSKGIGLQSFWDAALEGEAPKNLGRICEQYLQLLACYFIFVGCAGFCLTTGKVTAKEK